MKKLKVLIEKAMEGSKRKFKSLYDINEAMTVYNSIVQSKEAITINGNVYQICVDCGLAAKTQGIGWRITK